MKNFSLLLKLVAAVAVFSLPVSLYAANATWLGTTDGVWATGTNWSATPVPGTTNTATFNSAGGAVDIIDLGAGVTIFTLLFDTASAAGYTIGSGGVGVQSLTLDNTAAITINSAVANNQLVNAAITLGTTRAGSTSAFVITNNSTTSMLTLVGNIAGNNITGTAGNKTLTVTGAGDVLISGSISNGGASTIPLTKSGAGTLTMSGTNTQTGTVTVSGGTLKLDFSAAGAPTTNIFNNALNSSVLSLTGGTLNVTLSSSATANTQRFASTTFGTGSSALRVTQNGNSNAGSGLTLGALTRSSNGTVDFTLPTTGTITTTSTTAFTGTNRVLTATSTAYATNTGTDWVTNTVGGILGTTSGLYSDDVFTASSDVNITTSLAPAAFTVNTLRFNTNAADLTLNSSGASTVTAGGILVTSSGTNSVISSGGVGAGLTSGATSDQVVVHNYGGLTISAPIVDNGGAVSFVNTGSGTTILSGVNTYTGSTTVNAGTLALGSGGAIDNTSGITVSGGTLRLDTANVIQNFSPAINASNGLSFGSSVGTFTIGGLTGSTAGSIALTDSSAANVNLRIGNNNANATYSGIFTGGGSLEKIGTGNLTLTGVSTFSGGLTVKSGTVTTSLQTNNNALGTGTITLGDTAANPADASIILGTSSPPSVQSNNIIVAGGSTGVLSLGTNATSGSTGFSGSITMNNDLTIFKGSSSTFTVSGGISGTGDLTLGNNGATQTMTVSNSINNDGTITNTGLGASGLTISAAIGANVNGIIQNSSTSTMLLSGNNASFAGGVSINAGTLKMGSTTALNASNLVTFTGGGTFDMGNQSLTIGGLSGPVGNVTNEGANTRVLTLGGSGDYVYDGTISPTTTSKLAITVALTGGGSQTLNGTMTYTGNTIVNSGTLLINGTSDSAVVTVNNGGTLGGIGTLSGASIINSGGTLSPGNSPGTLTFNSDLTLAGGAGILGATGVFEGGDLVDVNGILTLNDDWNLTLQTGFQNNGSVTLFTYTTAGATMDLTPDLDISGLGFTPSGALTLTDTGSSIVLNGISVIPEPSTLLLLAAGLGFLVVRRLRRVL